MRSIPRRLLFFYLAGATVLALPHTVYAGPPNSLADAITRTEGAARRRTPIILLNAEQVRPSWENREAQEKLYALYREENAMPRLADVVECFNRQLVSCTTVQIIAPIKKFALNPNPGPPEEWARIGRERAAKQLFGSLTPAQWQAASGEGLTLSQLSQPKQKSWFLSLIPEPFVLQQMQKEGEEEMRALNKRQVIAPEQVRIRVIRTMDWSYRVKGQNNHYYSFGHSDADMHNAGEAFWVKTSEQNQQPQESYRDRLRDVVRREEPNKLKKSDLSFNSAPLYGKRIPLAGIKTLGELVQRVAESTGLELYAERRISGLKITLVGPQDATADAADVMKALCYGVAGAIRKVSRGTDTVYLLTNDQEGLAAPRLRLAEWASDVDALLAQEQRQFEATTRDGEFVKGVGFGENAVGLSPQVMARTEAQITSPDRYSNNTGRIHVAVSELDPAAQQRIKSDIARRGNIQDNLVLDAENIYPQFSVKVGLFVPGYGTFDGPNLTSLENMLKMAPPNPGKSPAGDLPTGPMVLPPTLAKFTALKIAPKSNAGVDKALKWAKQHGFQALIVSLSLWEPEETACLAHAVEVGATDSIKVYAAVSLLKVPVSKEMKADAVPGNLPYARNIFGETVQQYLRRRERTLALQTQENSYYVEQFAALRNINGQEAEWLDAASEMVQKAVAEQVREIAKTPGIAGVILTDTAAPGFDLIKNFYVNPLTSGVHSGYGEELRLALIRQENLDPIDLPASENLPPYFSMPEEGLIPFFPMDWNFRQLFLQAPAYRKDAATGSWKAVPAQADSSGYTSDVSGWNELRRSKNLEWLAKIRSQINTPAGVPLLWEGGPDITSYGSSPHIQPWKPSEAMPPEKRGEQALLSVSFPASYPQEYVRFALGPGLAQRLKTPNVPPYVGIVLDITMRDIDNGLALLDILKPAP